MRKWCFGLIFFKLQEDVWGGHLNKASQPTNIANAKGKDVDAMTKVVKLPSFHHKLHQKILSDKSMSVSVIIKISFPIQSLFQTDIHSNFCTL